MEGKKKNPPPSRRTPGRWHLGEAHLKFKTKTPGPPAMKGAWKAKKGASCHQALVLWGFLSTDAASRRGYEPPPPPALSFEVFFLLGVRGLVFPVRCLPCR